VIGSAPEPVRFGCLTLTTDYGYGSGFVGTLHAVAFRIAPTLRVIDLDHDVPAHDVRLGALRLERFMRVAPSGVHVGVVDPGVGGRRRPLAIEIGEHAFVGPDNGLLVWAAEACAAAGVGVDGAAGMGGAAGMDGIRAVVLDRTDYWLAHRSRTFDGRDIFVPVAAHLARATTLDQVGTKIDPMTLVRLERPIVRVRGSTETDLEVLQVDRFGNVQLSGDSRTVTALSLRAGDRLEFSTAGSAPMPATYVTTFSDVSEGSAAVLIDSDGCLALSVNCGRADVLLDAETRIVTIKRG
jgi:S-adenosyl-L-methionine hydrolase (adenosine-forming)